jgi:hypothetical protein
MSRETHSGLRWAREWGRCSKAPPSVTHWERTWEKKKWGMLTDYLMAVLLVTQWEKWMASNS